MRLQVSVAAMPVTTPLLDQIDTPDALRKLEDGDLMIIVGAGIGYVWGAGVVRWGEAP